MEEEDMFSDSDSDESDQGADVTDDSLAVGSGQQARTHTQGGGGEADNSVDVVVMGNVNEHEQSDGQRRDNSADVVVVGNVNEQQQSDVQRRDNSADVVVMGNVNEHEQSDVQRLDNTVGRLSGDVTDDAASTTQSVVDTSLDDFKSPKKYKLKGTKEKCEEGSESLDEEAECCPICFERWENSGSHRLASLRCGHLFGQSCIEKWLQGQGGKCPQCNAKASKKHIRLIYAKTLKMLDTTERDRALADLERERKLRQQAELETAQMKLTYQMALDECNRLREEVERHTSTLDVMRVQSSSSASSPSGIAASQVSSVTPGGSFVLDKTLKISEQGSCRVMAFSTHAATLCISQPSSSPLFPGFGVKKLSAVDFRTSQYVAVHSKQIRDVVFQSGSSLMLTASLDKTVKLTSLSSNSVVQTYSLPVPAWSCAYHPDDPNLLYAGLLNGSVAVFDMRNTSGSVRSLNTDGSKSPVVALHDLPADNRSENSRMSGLLIGQLDRCSFYQFESHDYRPHLLQIDGSVSSVAIDVTTRHALLTYRPSGRHPCVRHQMCAIACRQVAQASLCSLRPVHTFHGGSTQKHLTRSRLVPHPSHEGNLLVCAPDEASCSVHIWEATTGAVRQKLATALPVMDVCPIPLRETYHLCSLTEKNLMLYTWRS